MKVFKKFKVSKICYLLIAFFLIYSIGIFSKYTNLNAYGDEIHVIQSVLKFFRDWHFNDVDAYAFAINTILYIPSMIITFIASFLFGIVSSLEELKQLVIVYPYKLVPIFRITTILIALTTIYFFYKTCLLIFKKEKFALLGAYLLATSFIFTKVSFIAIKWIPQLLLVVFSIYFFLSLLKIKKWQLKHYLIVGLLIAASYGVALVGLIVAVPFLLIFYKAYKRGQTTNYKKGLTLTALVSLLFIALITVATPTLAQNSFGFFSNIVESGAGEQLADTKLSFRLFGYLAILFKTEALLLLLGIFGAFIAYKKNRFIFYLFTTYFVVFYILLGPIFGAIRERRALLLVPALIIFALFALAWLNKKINNRIIRGLLSILLLIFLVNPFIIRHELSKDDSMLLARQWIEDNVEEDSIIFDSCGVGLNTNLASMEYFKNNSLDLFTTQQKYLFDNPQLLEGYKKFFVIIYEQAFNKESLAEIKNGHQQYFILCHVSVAPEDDRNWEPETKKIAMLYDDYNLEEIYSFIDIGPKPHFLDKENRTDLRYFFRNYNSLYNSYNITIYKMN